MRQIVIGLGTQRSVTTLLASAIKDIYDYCMINHPNICRNWRGVHYL